MDIEHRGCNNTQFRRVITCLPTVLTEYNTLLYHGFHPTVTISMADPYYSVKLLYDTANSQ